MLISPLRQLSSLGNLVIQSWAQRWYGIEINEANSSPDVTRIAGTNNMGLHATLPVHSKIRGCLLNDNGTVNYYLKTDDWTKKADGTASNLDGTDGQVMIEWPDFWYEYDLVSAGVYDIKISQYPLTGFTKVAKHYVSAFEAAIKRSTTTMASVINTTTDYRGGNNTSAWDAAVNTFLGMPVTTLSRTNGRTYSRNRGPGWNQYGYSDHNWLFWFFVIEYATLNSQKSVNNILDINGYHQGGLGNGVTTADAGQWGTFNGYNAFIPCGASNVLGNNSGEVSYTKVNFGGAGVNVDFKVPRYRGIENPFGHIPKICDGINIEVQSVAGGDKTNTYVADNIADWNDVNYNNYINHGEQARATGYQKFALLGATLDFLPIDTTGDASHYYCDRYYNAIPPSTELRMLKVGGQSSDGTIAGLACSQLHSMPSSANVSIGFRLCFKAPEGVWEGQGTVLEASVLREDSNLYEPTVLYEGNAQIIDTPESVFKMWYTEGWGTPNISYAESLTGLPGSWIKYNNNPVVAGHMRSNLLKVGAIYYLFANNSDIAFDLYTSNDGVSFVLDTANILTIGSGVEWDSKNVGNCFVILEGGIFYMIYDGIKIGVAAWKQGLATSNDGRTWVKYVSNPVLTDIGNRTSSAVYKIGSSFYMWLIGGLTSASLPTDLVYRYKSTDLITWVQDTTQFVFARMTADEGYYTSSGQVADPALLEVNNKVYLFYAASIDGNQVSGNMHIKLAIADMPFSELILTDEGRKQ